MVILFQIAKPTMILMMQTELFAAQFYFAVFFIFLSWCICGREQERARLSTNNLPFFYTRFQCCYSCGIVAYCNAHISIHTFDCITTTVLFRNPLHIQTHIVEADVYVCIRTQKKHCYSVHFIGFVYVVLCVHRILHYNVYDIQ